MAEDIFPKVNIYTDGGAEPNPGKGGFGVIMTYKGHKKEFSKGYLLTTNNRMELMGVIFGLEQLKKPSIINIYSDSKYVVDGISKGWAESWKSKNWYRTKSEKAINFDLWEKLLDLISKQQSVTFNWVKGHAGHKENERCDELADIALNGKELFEDFGYEPSTEKKSSIVKLQENNNSYNKSKILIEGDICRKCNTPVTRKETKKKTFKPNQEYYYDYYLLCSNCKTMFMVEEAKKYINESDNQLF